MPAAARHQAAMRRASVPKNGAGKALNSAENTVAIALSRFA